MFRRILLGSCVSLVLLTMVAGFQSDSRSKTRAMYRVIPKTQKHLELLHAVLPISNKVAIWSSTSGIGEPVDFLVPYQEVYEVLQKLQKEGMTSTLVDKRVKVSFSKSYKEKPIVRNKLNTTLADCRIFGKVPDAQSPRCRYTTCYFAVSGWVACDDQYGTDERGQGIYFSGIARNTDCFLGLSTQFFCCPCKDSVVLDKRLMYSANAK